MIEQVNFCDFCDRFTSHDRQDSYSYEAKRAIFDYLEELEEDCGEPIELDVIAICCDWDEHGSAMECAASYAGTDDTIETCEHIGMDESIAMRGDWDEMEEAAMEWLRDETQVIEFEGGIVVGAF